MNIETYRVLLAQARRLTRATSDAEDLVQDTLIAALQAGRSDAPWLAGTLRLQWAQSARAARRRRRREETVARLNEEAVESMAASPGASLRTLLAALPPAARRLATLALHGLNGDEIRWILNVSPAAFRQRLTSIRKALSALSQSQRADYTDLALAPPARPGGHDFGLIRRALKAALQGQDGLATHDVDGHLIVLRARPKIEVNLCSQIGAQRQQRDMPLAKV